MKSLVKHLVEDHNYKRIMFVTGPENNCEAMERYEGYLEVLKENNIPVDENIIFNGNFNSHTGYRIMKEVILNDIRYDAAVFSNDDMALGALKAIDDLSQKHEIDISKRSIICGFDDVTNAKLTSPPLTTVSQPFEDICEGAVKVLLDKIDGKETEDIIKYPAALVKRQSFGCKKDTVLDEISNKYLRLIPRSIFSMGVKTYNLNEIPGNLKDADSETALFLHTMRVQLPMMILFYLKKPLKFLKSLFFYMLSKTEKGWK